jgi:uncharacterized protein
MRLQTGLLTLFIAAGAAAQDVPRIAKYIPPSPHPEHVFVFDSAHVLSTETATALQDSARSLQAETGADIVWVTLPTLGGRAIEEAALYIGRTWRVGSAGKPGDPRRNRGLVVLYVPDKTKTAGSNFRIEVGNGLEGTITDSRSRTITSAMREDLRAKRYDQAYLAGWNVAARLVREDAASTASVAPASAAAASFPAPSTPRPASSDNALGFVIMGMMVVGFGLFVLLLVVANRKRATAGSPARRTRRRAPDQDPMSTWMSTPSIDYGSSSSSSMDSSSSSGGGGDMGGGGGFSGGGSSDSI